MSLRLNKGDDNFVFISVFISNYITIKKKTIILVSRTGFQSFPNVWFRENDLRNYLKTCRNPESVYIKPIFEFNCSTIIYYKCLLLDDFTNHFRINWSIRNTILCMQCLANHDKCFNMKRSWIEFMLIFISKGWTARRIDSTVKPRTSEASNEFIKFLFDNFLPKSQ